MKKKVILFPCVFFALLVLGAFTSVKRKTFPANQQEELIFWSYEVKLSWDDFKAKPDPKNNKTALTTAGLSIKTDQSSPNKIQVQIESRFQPNLSWSKDKDNDYLLMHEQKHFDLVEVYARTARKTFLENNRQPKTKLVKYLENVFESTQKELRNRQELYDRETDHSRDSLQQVKWNKQINKELRELKDFAEKTVEIELY